MKARRFLPSSIAAALIALLSPAASKAADPTLNPQQISVAHEGTQKALDRAANWGQNKQSKKKGQRSALQRTGR